MQQQLNHTKGTERILVLNDLAYEYGYVDFNKSISLAKEALHLSEIQKYNKAKALTYDILGRAYFISGNNKTADDYYNMCISTANKYGTKDDIYKALRHKTMVFVNGYIRDSNELITVFKKYINMTIEKNNFNDFQEGLKSFAYVSHYDKINNLDLIGYFDQLKSRTKNNPEFVSSVYAGEAFFYKQNLEYFKAIQKYEQAIKLTKNINAKISHLERIGNINFEIRKHKESVIYYCDALKLLNSHKKESESFMYYLLEADLGASYLQLKDYKSALSSLKKALEHPFFSNRDRGAIFGNMGIAYLSINSLDSADYYLNKALIISESIGSNSDKLAYLNSKAELVKRRQQWNQLPSVITEISELVNEVNEFYIVYDSFELLSNYYEKSGNYEKSSKYLKKWIIVNDSINNRDFMNKISEFQFKYETEKKEQQIALQQTAIKDKNLLLVFLVIGGSLIFVGLMVILVLYRIKNKAYKQLVYQSLENTSNALLVKIEENTDEENTIEIKNGISPLDESIKNKIEISLNKQLDAKVYLDPNLILKTLADKCVTNRSYLSQFINERYNMNFNTFINTLRINEAKEILSNKNNDIPLKDLYLRLGFKTYSVFNEAFKKHVGVTPNFYQKTVKELFDTSNPNKIL